jgi:hypothetical protein
LTNAAGTKGYILFAPKLDSEKADANVDVDMPHGDPWQPADPVVTRFPDVSCFPAKP